MNISPNIEVVPRAIKTAEGWNGINNSVEISIHANPADKFATIGCRLRCLEKKPGRALSKLILNIVREAAAERESTASTPSFIAATARIKTKYFPKPPKYVFTKLITARPLPDETL